MKKFSGVLAILAIGAFLFISPVSAAKALSSEVVSSPGSITSGDSFSFTFRCTNSGDQVLNVTGGSNIASLSSAITPFANDTIGSRAFAVNGASASMGGVSTSVASPYMENIFTASDFSLNPGEYIDISVNLNDYTSLAAGVQVGISTSCNLDSAYAMASATISINAAAPVTQPDPQPSENTNTDTPETISSNEETENNPEEVLEVDKEAEEASDESSVVDDSNDDVKEIKKDNKMIIAGGIIGGAVIAGSLYFGGSKYLKMKKLKTNVAPTQEPSSPLV